MVSYHAKKTLTTHTTAIKLMTVSVLTIPTPFQSMSCRDVTSSINTSAAYRLLKNPNVILFRPQKSSGSSFASSHTGQFPDLPLTLEKPMNIVILVTISIRTLLQKRTSYYMLIRIYSKQRHFCLVLQTMEYYVDCTMHEAVRLQEE